jgi:hypothetical protein
MRAREQKLDRLEQTMVDLARLMGFAQKDHEEKSNLPENLMKFYSMMGGFQRKNL